MSHFQLFPPISSEANPKATNPFRKGNKKLTIKTKPSSPIHLQEIATKSPSNTEAVLFRIIEDTKSIPPPPPPKPEVGRSDSSSSIEISSPESKSSKITRVSSRKTVQSRAWTSLSEASSSSTLVDGHNVNYKTEVPPPPPKSSPPMRSMFPRYNPNLPLDQQEYHPRASADAPRQISIATAKRPERLAISPPPEIDTMLGPRTVPASVMDFPAGALEPAGVRYASEYELRTLWDAANGQKPQNMPQMINLPMARTEVATFTFGNPEAPFYKMQTYSTNELSIARSDPSQPNRSVPVMMLNLEDRSRREAPHDGLVAMLLSRLAAMLAIDQAAELAKLHGLSPSEASEVEENALKRAAAQESCRLYWNRDGRRYELQHPALEKQPPPALIGAGGVALSPMRTKQPGRLHITVSTHSGNTAPHRPPSILITTPVSVDAIETAELAAGTRTSTLPLTDYDEPLASLDFATMTLSISPALIGETMPSLYAIDSLVTAMLAVAVSDEATNPILADMKLHTVEDKTTGPKYQSFFKTTGSKTFTGKLVTTLAEREDAMEGSKLVSQVKAAKDREQPEPRKGSFFSKWFRSKPKEKKNKKQIVVEEFDLEKYGRYSSGSSREGEKLPGIVRALLRLLFWGLDLLVFSITLLTKILAWVLVNATRCVTSEKF